MRRYFHMTPELSNKEFETRKTIISELEKMGVEYRLAAGTGLVAIIKGEKPGKHHLLRCDMDALPVKEDTDNLIQPKACVSQKPGVCHACGHDAHMAMMLTTIKVLSQIREQLKGTVYCCFEEGEEALDGYQHGTNVCANDRRWVRYSYHNICYDSRCICQYALIKMN